MANLSCSWSTTLHCTTPGRSGGEGRRHGASKATGQRQDQPGPERANCQPTTFRSQRRPGRERRVALRGCVSPPSQGEASRRAPSWPCNEWGQGHRLGPSLGRAGVGLPPPPATAEGVQASRGRGAGGREWPGRTGGVLTWGEKGDGLHQHVLLLMQLQLLQPVVELQHGLQEKLLEATCRWV